ncbi:MAG: hypothetical protein ABSB15_16040 [Bryobacteraceae bacterium]|jgi:hypothetical protein
MTKKPLKSALLFIAATFALTASAQAGYLYAAVSTLEYQSANGYDFSGAGNYPPTTYQNIGTFSFTPILAADLSSITISGTFGNEDYGSTTALSDYFLGDSADGEEAVGVAQCDSASANCYSGQNGPYNWSLTLNAAQIADLANGLLSGSIDFGYTWDQGTPAISDPIFGDQNGYDLQYVNAGPATLDLYTPEPATVFYCFSGLAAVAAFRRFRKS